MNLTLQCPHCQNLLEVDPAWAGHQLDCPLCHNAFSVASPPVTQQTLPPPLPALPPSLPKLWNPNAAASWSVLFGPAFGPYLHHLNWRALGDHGKAAAAFRWFVVGLIATILLTVWVQLSPSLGSAAFVVSLFLMAVWLYASGKKQINFIKEHYGENYERRSWWQPLLGGFGALILLSITLELTGGALREEVVMRQSVEIVNDILTRSNIGPNVRCLRVQLDGNAGPNDYFATAFFTTGDSAPARVQVQGDVILVNLEPSVIMSLKMYQAVNSLLTTGRADKPSATDPEITQAAVQQTATTSSPQNPTGVTRQQPTYLDLTLGEWFAKVESTVGLENLRALQKGQLTIGEGEKFLEYVSQPTTMEPLGDSMYLLIWAFEDGHVALTISRESWDDQKALMVVKFQSEQTGTK